MHKENSESYDPDLVHIEQFSFSKSIKHLKCYRILKNVRFTTNNVSNRKVEH